MDTTDTPSGTIPPATFGLHGVAELSHLGIIEIAGEDAATFIHGQLTQDFSLLGNDQARLAAFCSAKGRVLASFIGIKRSPSQVWLVCSRDLLATTLKRLSMFVLRAKAKLTDVSSQYALYGLAGNAINKEAATAHGTWSRADFGGATLVQLYPADGVPRQLWIGPVNAAKPAGEALALDAWLWGEVRSGVATVSAPVVDAFVPQMLNYESVGGVNFKKGCYPGQEVVARSQFRGTLKRRAFLVHCESALHPADELFSAEDNEQPVATVVQAAAAPQGGFDAIISAQVTAVEHGPIHLRSSTGPVLTLLPRPYALLEDV